MSEQHMIHVLNVAKEYKSVNMLMSKHKRSKKVLIDVNLKIKKGEVCGLVGANASGKTTLIKILATVLLPTTGRVFINGYDLRMQPLRVRNIIGFVSGQERYFDWRITGRQNLVFFAALHEIFGEKAQKRIDMLAELLDIRYFIDRPFHEYSSGVRQRLSIACGLMHTPEVILLDEPTRSLDQEIAPQIHDFIKKEIIKKQQKTVFFTSPNQVEAQKITDYILFLKQGLIQTTDDN